MKRRGCKGIGGIHWDEMTIKEGIVLCKRTGELVGFEEDKIPNKFNVNFEDLDENDVESCYCEESDNERYDESDNDSSVCSDGSECQSVDQSNITQCKKAKLICQFFFSSLEGDFTWPVASFPLNRINHKILSSMVWKVCESLGSLSVLMNIIKYK